MRKLSLVYDIGGTHLRCGLYDLEHGRLIRTLKRRTPHYSDFTRPSQSSVRKSLLQAVSSIGEETLQGLQPDCVSVAFPGPIDATGKVLTAPTIWGRADDKPVQFLTDLQSLWPQVRVSILNDVSAAGYYYLRHPNEDLCVVTVSSGIGHKVFSNGKPLVGKAGRGGEIGHLRIGFSSDAPLCECGEKGHLAAMSSGRASLWQAVKLASEDPSAFSRSALAYGNVPVDSISNEEIVKAFRTGDPWTATLIDRMAKPLGQVLAGIHLTAGVERFVIIGGFAAALGDEYRKLLVRYAAASAWHLGTDWQSMIELGAESIDAGLIGAGRYAASQTATEFSMAKAQKQRSMTPA